MTQVEGGGRHDERKAGFALEGGESRKSRVDGGTADVAESVSCRRSDNVRAPKSLSSGFVFLFVKLLAVEVYVVERLARWWVSGWVGVCHGLVQKYKSRQIGDGGAMWDPTGPLLLGVCTYVSGVWESGYYRCILQWGRAGFLRMEERMSGAKMMYEEAIATKVTTSEQLAVGGERAIIPEEVVESGQVWGSHR